MMRTEVLAIGSELLLGQIADTNSTVIARKLADGGIPSYFRQVAGDNRGRIALALRTALARSDVVIVSGGLGPTPDDITREAIADVMNAELVRDESVASHIRELFAARGIKMAGNNLRQADVPAGATVMPQTSGTAPGLICPMGQKVIYAVPGVPSEMVAMIDEQVIPDLKRRMRERGTGIVLVSRTIRTWGLPESALAEKLESVVRSYEKERTEAAEADAGPGAESGARPRVTMAFLASAVEGIRVRLTASGPGELAALETLEREVAGVRALLGRAVFSADDERIEEVVGRALENQGATLAVAESFTGGLVSSRLVSVPGASKWFKGGVVSYGAEVKHKLLGVPDGPVVTRDSALAMARGVAELLGADAGLAFTGVAGPDPQEGLEPGTVFIGVVLSGEVAPSGTTDPVAAPPDPVPQVPAVLRAQPSGTYEETVELTLPGDRETVRQLAVMSGLDLLRRRIVPGDTS